MKETKITFDFIMELDDKHYYTVIYSKKTKRIKSAWQTMLIGQRLERPELNDDEYIIGFKTLIDLVVKITIVNTASKENLERVKDVLASPSK